MEAVQAAITAFKAAELYCAELLGPFTKALNYAKKIVGGLRSVIAKLENQKDKKNKVCKKSCKGPKVKAWKPKIWWKPGGCWKLIPKRIAACITVVALWITIKATQLLLKVAMVALKVAQLAMKAILAAIKVIMDAVQAALDAVMATLKLLQSALLLVRRCKLRRRNPC
jgi:hypothetical protein